MAKKKKPNLRFLRNLGLPRFFQRFSFLFSQHLSWSVNHPPGLHLPGNRLASSQEGRTSSTRAVNTYILNFLYFSIRRSERQVSKAAI
jgi:hypothetical protein